MTCKISFSYWTLINSFPIAKNGKPIIKKTSQCFFISRTIKFLRENEFIDLHRHILYNSLLMFDQLICQL